jgi:hypothetical protein
MISSAPATAEESHVGTHAATRSCHTDGFAAVLESRRPAFGLVGGQSTKQAPQDPFPYLESESWPGSQRARGRSRREAAARMPASHHLTLSSV